MFAFNTFQTSEHVIKQIVSKGATILYDHYLNQKVPQHLNSQNQNYMEGITNGEIKLYDKQQGIKSDFEAKRILKDNYVAKSLQIKKISMGSKIQANNEKPILVKLKQKNKYLNKDTKNIIEAIKKTQKKESLLQTIIPLEQQKKYTKQQTQYIKYDDQLRNAKKIEAIIAKEQQRKKRQQLINSKTHRLLLEKQYEDVTSRNLKYTYDFSGKILLCTPLNTNKQIYTRTLNPDIKVNIYDQKPQQLSKESVNIIHTGKIISNQLYSAESLDLNRKKPKTSRINQKVGTDPVKNQIYNNNNNRQMSNLNLIELVEGATLIELQNQNKIETQRKKPLSKRQFQQKNADSKFKSFFITLNQKIQSQIADDFIENNQQVITNNKQQRLKSTRFRTGTSFVTKNPNIKEFKQIQESIKKNENRPLSGISRLKSNKGIQRVVIENKNMIQMLIN